MSSAAGPSQCTSGAPAEVLGAPPGRLIRTRVSSRGGCLRPPWGGQNVGLRALFQKLKSSTSNRDFPNCEMRVFQGLRAIFWGSPARFCKKPKMGPGGHCRATREGIAWGRFLGNIRSGHMYHYWSRSPFCLHSCKWFVDAPRYYFCCCPFQVLQKASSIATVPLRSRPRLVRIPHTSH